MFNHHLQYYLQYMARIVLLTHKHRRATLKNSQQMINVSCCITTSNECHFEHIMEFSAMRVSRDDKQEQG